MEKWRGSIIPALMWYWAYKSKKPPDNDDSNKPSLVYPPPIEPVDDITVVNLDNEDEKAIVDGLPEKRRW